MPKIEIKRLNDNYLMEAKAENGSAVRLDASKSAGGDENGFSPMQLLLAGLGGCSGIDVISILKKQRADIKDVQITVEGERQKNATPALWEKAHVHFKFFGNVENEKAERAVELSMTKYCSAVKTLETSCAITYSFEVIKQSH